MRPPFNPFDLLLAEIGRAVRDIREEVVEEGWFGRKATNPAPDIPPQDHSYDDAGNVLQIADEHFTDSPLGWEQPRESIGLQGFREPSFEDLWGPREKGPDDAEKAPDQSLSRDLER